MSNLIKTVYYTSKKGKLMAHVVGLNGCIAIHSFHLGKNSSMGIDCYTYVAIYKVGAHTKDIKVKNVLMASDQTVFKVKNA